MHDPLRFNIDKERHIQFGRNRRGRADLVLLAGDDPIVIVECKRQGYIDSGLDQLKSYICATTAQLGIFANSPNPNNWIYLDRGNINKFAKIDHETFQKRVWEEQKIEQSIKEQTERHIDAIAKERAEGRETDIEKRTQKMIEEEAQKRVTEFAIRTVVERELRDTNASLQREINTLEKELRESREEFRESKGCLIWGWVLFFIVLILFVLVISES